MALTRVKNLTPDVETLAQRVHQEIFSGNSADALAASLLIGATFAGDTSSGVAARLRLENQYFKIDPEHPGNSKLIGVWRNPQVEEWLMAHPGKAVLICKGGMTKRGFHAYEPIISTGPGAPVQGWGDGNSYYRITSGEPAKIVANFVQIVHGYLTGMTVPAGGMTPARTFQLWQYYCGYANSAHLANLGADEGVLMLMDVSAQPVQYRGGHLYSFDAVFGPTMAHHPTCISKKMSIGYTSQTSVLSTGKTIRRNIKIHSTTGSTFVGQSNLPGTTGFTPWDNMLTNGW